MNKLNQNQSLKFLLPLITINLLLFSAIPAKAEIDEIKNAVWEKVPGTEPSEDSINSGQYDESAYVDVHGIIKQGQIITYDLINQDSGYVRMQTNCQTKVSRAIRMGAFQSETRVEYTDLPQENWTKSSGSYQSAIINFVCKL